MNCKWTHSLIRELMPFSTERSSSEDVSLNNYVSTDTLLQNRAGREIAISVPSFVGKIPAYKCGDILIGNIRPYLKKIWLADIDGGCSADVLVFHPSKDINNRLAYYILSQDCFFDFMMKSSKGSKMPRGDKQAIENYSLSIPLELSEQQHIADILTSCDEAIEQTEKAIAKYRDIKSGMLQDLFTRGLDSSGKLRPKPEDAPELFKDSPLGKIPKEWEIKTLAKCCSSPMYGLNASAIPFDKIHKYIRITDISDVSHKYLKEDIVSPAFYSDLYLVVEGDILFARTGASVGKTYIYDINDGLVYFAGFLIRFHVLQEYNPNFIFYQTETFRYNNWVSIMSMRTGQPGVNSLEYSSFQMSIPTKRTEQDLIAERLLSIDAQIEEEERALGKYRSLKLGLMKQLLTPPEGALEA